MMFDTNPLEEINYYEVLDIAPSATPSEVRTAYLRAKSAYNKDSVALYSLIDPGERDNMLRRIEEAYDVLSNDNKRREYDANHGIIENTGTIDHKTVPIAKVVSIDRVPPMESLTSEEDMLVAPSTDFATTEPPRHPISHPISQPIPHPVPQNPAPPAAKIEPRAESTANEIEREIQDETQWHGSFIRRVRDAHRVSIEEMSNTTKISKTYINAIEGEDFKKLPALVFMRGFLVQICRILKLPQDKVLEAYLHRFKAAKQQD